jgi:hypothetical protein
MSAVFVVFTAVGGVYGQDAGHDRAGILLDLKKARADYEVARQRMENDTRLYGEKAISENEFTRSKNELLSREVDYQKLILQLVSQQSYVVIERAVKYRTAGGERRVKITVKSTLEGNEEFLSQFEGHFDVFTPEMRAGKVYNVFVSLSDISDRTIIGSPYEFRIPAVETGGEASADFELLKDAENLMVTLNYNGRTVERNVYLKQDASVNVIDIGSVQFSQEADLGSSAVYGLTLERFSTSDDVYRLLVAGLPRRVSYEFMEESNRVSQIKFAQGVNTRKLSLRVFLPDRDDGEVVIDSLMRFMVLAVTGESYGRLSGRDLEGMTVEQLSAVSCGRELLELVPRGRGRIEVRATSLYHEISTGDSVVMTVTVRNAGTRRLDNVKISAESPVGWKTVVRPDLIRSLEPEGESVVSVSIFPPVDGGVGAQEVKIKTEAVADNRKVDTEDKTVRIQVNAGTPVVGTVLLLLLLVGAVGGLVWFGVKLSRR